MVDFPPELYAELAELLCEQRAIQLNTAGQDKKWFEERLKELLEKVHGFVEKFQPDSYTVTVGMPFIATVSFSFASDESERKGQ